MTRSFRDLVLRSSALNLAVTFGLKAALLAQAVLYARVFAPAEIGAVATVVLILSFTQILGQMGLNESIIRETGDPRRTMDVAFTLALATSSGLLALMIGGAPLVAATLGSEALSSYLRVLALTLFLMPLSLPTNTWVREFRFGVARLPNFAEVLVATVVALSLHLGAGFGVWSLVVGRLLGFATNVCLVWAIAPYRPRPRWDRKVAAALYAFGWPILVSSLLNFAIWQGDDMLVRYFGGDASLAFYGLAFALPFYIKEVADVAIASLLPMYARLNDEPERVGRAFMQVNRYLNILFVPCGVALYALADPLIHVVFGPKWAPCVRPLEIFALAFTVEVLGGYSWGILAMARGKTKYLMYVKIWVTLYLLTAGTYCIWRWGIVGGAVYTLTQALLTVTLVRGFILYRELGSLAYLKDSVKPLAASALGGVAVLAVRQVASDRPVILVAGALAYAAATLLGYVVLDRKFFAEMRGIASALRPGR